MNGREFANIRRMTGMSRMMLSAQYGIPLSDIADFEDGRRLVTPPAQEQIETVREDYEQGLGL